MKHGTYFEEQMKDPKFRKFLAQEEVRHAICPTNWFFYSTGLR